MFTHDIVIWSVRLRPTRAKPYEVRWKTGDEPHSKSFVTSALADNFRSDLRQAAKKGELFDVESGLPKSALEQAAAAASAERPGLTWFELARKYVADRWEDDSAKMREGIVDALATATLALLDDEAAKLDRALVRPAMRWALIPTGLDQHPEKYAHIIKVLSHPPCGRAGNA